MNIDKGSSMRNKAKIREEAKKLNLIDDLMFRTMAEDKAFCEEILRVIPDVCVVFISRFDIFSGNRSLYHVDRVIRETRKVVDNGFEKVYVNARVKDGSEVAELMEVFVDDTAYNSKFPVTSGSKRRYKETEEGQQIMCEIMERIAMEERNEGRLEGEARINALNSILINLNRFDDLKRAATDRNFQMRLMIELLPEKV